MGTEVVVLLLPESSSLRALIPPEAMSCLREALGRGFGPDAPMVVDLRAAIADDQFHDSIHPNKSGREATTRQLLEALHARPTPASPPKR